VNITELCTCGTQYATQESSGNLFSILQTIIIIAHKPQKSSVGRSEPCKLHCPTWSTKLYA